MKDHFLRQAADFQNFRKRAIEERAYSVEIGRSQVALPMVDVLDDLRRSLGASESVDSSDQTAAAEANSVVALGEGVRLVFEKLEFELAKLRVTPMDVVGQPFDENRHDALMQQPAPDGTEPGTVLAEIQKGYLIGDKVLRHARVVVAS
jgi:molecular chaperone GrpE